MGKVEMGYSEIIWEHKEILQDKFKVEAKVMIVEKSQKFPDGIKDSGK